MVLLAAAACKKEPAQPAAPDRSEHIYTFETSAASKTVLGEDCVEWEEGDCIGTFAKGQQNIKSGVAVGTPCTFAVKTTGKLEAGDKVYAYAPYGAEAGTAASEVTVTIPSEQSTAHFAMPLAAVPFEVETAIEADTETPVAGMSFCNLASAAVLRIFSDGTVGAGEKIQSVTLSSESDVCGSYTIDLTAIDASKEETLALTPKTGAKAVTVNLASAADVAVEAQALEIPVVLAPGSHTVTVVVKTDRTSYFKTSAEPVEFARNYRKPLALNLAEAEHYGIEKVEPAELRSFKKGESLEYAIAFTGECSVTASCPDGWTAAVEGTKLTVTAPADDTKALEGNVVLTVGGTATEIPVRLAGINSQEDLVAFTKSVNNMLDDGYKIDPMYLVDDELSINADITIPSGSMAYGAYWLKRLQTPINGNGHTLTFNTTHGTRGGLVQNLGADVHDLKLAGTISAKDANAHVGSLACLLSKAGLTVSNVISTVEFTISNTGCRAGGLIGAGDTTFGQPTSFTMKNCQFNGKMIITANAYAVGGLLGDASDNNVRFTFENCSSKATITVGACKVANLGGLVGRGGASDNILTFNECEFGGVLSYTLGGSEYDLTRIGGLLGNLERGGVFTKCSFTGKITADWNGGRILGAGGGSCGIGGFVGRNTGHSDNAALNIKAIFTDCVSKGTIAVTSSTDSEAANKARLGHIIGSSNNTNVTTHVETGCTYGSTITVNGKEFTIEK